MSGAFPMAHPDQDNAIYWHTPAIRGIIPLDHRFKVPRNLMNLYQKKPFDLYINKDFPAVIRECGKRTNESTWISEEIIDAYIELHNRGFAHSFEAWQDKRLVGGLYGVSIGRAFCGESMFYRVSNASKIALIFLVEFLREKNYVVLDTQYLNPHLKQFGAYEISNDEYLDLLSKAIEPKNR